MFVKQRFRLWPALRWTSRVFPLVGLWATALTLLHVGVGWEWVRLPALPVSVLGTAVAFYLGFKGNAAYERLWEARKIWGGIVNSSRTWGVFVTTLISDLHNDGVAEPALEAVHREMVYRHVAWLGALRTQLRRFKTWEHVAEWNHRYRRLVGTFDNSPEVLRRRISPFVPEDELEPLMAKKNQATQILLRQGQRVQELFAQGRLDDFRHMQFASLIEELYTLQGKAERIKNFPLPRQYATANHWFVIIFITMLPAAMLDAFHLADVPEAYAWVSVPLSMVIAWVFFMWDRVVDYSENPFEGLINDIPVDALSRTIEIDLREMLGETELPPPIQARDGEALF